MQLISLKLIWKRDLIMLSLDLSMAIAFARRNNTLSATEAYQLRVSFTDVEITLNADNTRGGGGG